MENTLLRVSFFWARCVDFCRLICVWPVCVFARCRCGEDEKRAAHSGMRGPIEGELNVGG